MKKLIVLILVLVSLSTWAKKKESKPTGHTPSTFQVVATNSPVKETYAKFQLNLPAGFELDKIKVKLKDTRDLFDKKKPKFEDVSVQNNNLLQVNVSKLPPGFYRLYVKVIDKKSKKEHDFKTKYHDYVRFVVDESMEVPEPDPKKDSETLGGIDIDTNGIPDRIQRWINANFANKPNTKMAAKQYAMASQNVILNSKDEASTLITMTNKAESFSCLYWIRGIASNSIHEELGERFYNTEQRIRKLKEVGRFYHGAGRSKRIMDLDTEERNNLCDFEAQKEM